MANSEIIGNLKNIVIKKIVENELIVTAIDSPEAIKENWKPAYLIDSYATKMAGFIPQVFKYSKNTEIIDKAITFINIMVDTPNIHTRNRIFSKIRLTIRITSHEEHMIVSDRKILINRNDYLGELIDKSLNGCTLAGIGQLELITSIEAMSEAKFPVRQLTFETIDLNNSMCEK